MIDNFHEAFSSKVEELEIQHREELFHLCNVKRRYNAMVLEEGRENVDRKLLISEIQSKRRRYILHGDNKEEDQTPDGSRVNLRTPGFDEKLLY